jgi:hypothetical protein
MPGTSLIIIDGLWRNPELKSPNVRSLAIYENDRKGSKK